MPDERPPIDFGFTKERASINLMEETVFYVGHEAYKQALFATAQDPLAIKKLLLQALKRRVAQLETEIGAG